MTFDAFVGRVTGQPFFDLLLGKEKDPRKHYINEIRDELMQMLEKINHTLP